MVAGEPASPKADPSRPKQAKIEVKQEQAGKEEQSRNAAKDDDTKQRQEAKQEAKQEAAVKEEEKQPGASTLLQNTLMSCVM